MTKQNKYAIILLIIWLFITSILYSGEYADLYIRVLLGVSLGYVLTRGYFGFAGSVNRAMRGHSLLLMRSLMYLFTISSFLVGMLLIVNGGVEGYNLWINPINLGLLLGGTLFGIGMSFASCCATGTMTDGVLSPLKMLTVVLGFGSGILLGFPLQTSKEWIQIDIFTKETTGISFLDISNNIVIGVIFGILMTALFSYIVIRIINKIENKWNEEGLNPEIGSEKLQVQMIKEDKPAMKKPFTMLQTIILLSIIFMLMTLLTKSGWGASTPFGMWIGKLLIFLGVDTQTIGEFTGKGVEFFETPILYHGISVQNISILIGGIVAALSLDIYKPNWKMTKKEFLLFFIGGLLMGFGTRLSNGCNVGALYTPIANFALSGWVFLIFMVIGGIVGNKIYKKI